MEQQTITPWGRAFVVATLAVLVAATTARAEVRIAVVDMQRALNECEAGRKAKDQVRAKFEKAQDQLKRQREDLDRMREDYDKKALVLKEDERRSLEKDLESRQLDFKRRYEDFQRDLKRTDAELTSGIVEGLYGVVQDVGEKNGYSFVFERSSGALLYADKSSDITDEVVRIYNSTGGPPRRRTTKDRDE